MLAAQTVGMVLGAAVCVAPTLVGAAAPTGLAVVGMLSSREVRNLRHRLPTSAETAPAVMEESTG